MKRKLIFLLSTLIVLCSLSTSYAAQKDDSITEGNIITLQQAKGLVYKNSRELKQYEISSKKAKYQMQQTDHQYDEAIDEYNNIGSEWESSEGDSDSIEQKLDAQYETLDSYSEKITDVKNGYDDAVAAEDNYKKELDYLVEELYTTILNQEASLLELNKEYDLQQYLLDIERKKLQLGNSNQSEVDQLKAELSNLNKEITEQKNQIKTNKGELNDMMGKDYDDELNLSSFEVSTEIEIPEYEQLLTDYSISYDDIWQLKRDINELEDDLDEEDNYYESILLRQDIKEKELELETKKNETHKTISNLLTDVMLKQENYQCALTNYRDAKRSYNWDKKRYEVGTISKITLMKSELNYLDMKHEKDSTGYDLYLVQHILELASDGIAI